MRKSIGHKGKYRVKWTQENGNTEEMDLLKYREFHLKIRKLFFILMVFKRWSKLPREWSLHLCRQSKPNQIQPWASCCRWPCCKQEDWAGWSPAVPSNLSHPVVQWIKPALPFEQQKASKTLGSWDILINMYFLTKSGNEKCVHI